MQGFQRFWMVCRMPTDRGSRTEPRTRYPSIGAARDAARDLAYQNNHPFVVLEAAEVIQPKDLLTKPLF